jgi:lysophospholipase L1-like esterase
MKPALVNAGLVLLTLSLMLGLFELYLWVRYDREHQELRERYVNHELCTRASHDSRLIYELVPGKTCRVNSLGFMDIERAFIKPSNTFRILLIGDSIAQGQGVPRQARFGNLVETGLQATYPARNHEVINLAITGYSTSQELVVLESIGMRFQPDLILWSYVLNDPAHPVFHDANGELGRYFYRPVWRGRHYVEKKWFKAREKTLKSTCGSEFHLLLHCAYRNQVVEEIGLLGEISASTGVPVVFLIHPLLEQNSSFSSYPFQLLHDDLRQIASTAGLQVIDLVEAVQGESPESLSVSKSGGRYDPWHPNQTGHRLFAEYLLRKLPEMGVGIE